MLVIESPSSSSGDRGEGRIKVGKRGDRRGEGREKERVQLTPQDAVSTPKL